MKLVNEKDCHHVILTLANGHEYDLVPGAYWVLERRWDQHTGDTEGFFSVALANGVRLQRANISRRAGLNNLRAYLHVDARTQAPRFRMMDTPGNRRLYDCLTSMVLDPDDSEDVLKVDATDGGAGGDDAYDTLRYGLAARPLEGQPAPEPPFRAFSPEALQAELEQKRIFQHRRKKAARRPTPDDIF